MLLVEALLVAMPAAWLSLGAWDNIFNPSINRDDVTRVMPPEPSIGVKPLSLRSACSASGRVMDRRTVFTSWSNSVRMPPEPMTRSRPSTGSRVMPI